jgi:hypothetical protein
LKKGGNNSNMEYIKWKKVHILTAQLRKKVISWGKK